MRRIIQVVLCGMLVCFGVVEIGGFGVYKGEAAAEVNELMDPPASIYGSNYELQPLRAGSAVYESDIERLGNYSSLTAAAVLNDRVEAVKTDPKQKLVYLTFDDGPSAHTAQVLDILKKENIKATFFVLGEHVSKLPKIAKRIVQEGHTIGNHTYNHKYDRLYGNFTEFSSQIIKTDDAIFKATGIRTTFVRAPGGTFGNFDKGYFDALKDAGYQVYDWNVDSGDSKLKDVPASEIIATVKGSRQANKLIVLMHDSVGHKESVKALPAVIQYYKSEGYSFALITDKVEPIQFAIAKKIKWSRANVTKQQAAVLKQFRKEIDRSSLPVEMEKEESTAPVLILHRGEASLELSPNEYKIRNGSIEMPLLKLTKWIGGTWELDEKSGVIDAVLNGDHVVWKSEEKVVLTMEKAEQVVVPMRATLKQFGIDITDYIINGKQREIWMTM